MKIIAIIAAPLCFLASSLSQAAEVPKTTEKLEATATHVVRGKVMDVTSKIEKSKIHTNPDTQTDTIYTITVQVEGISKGDGAKKDEKITVLAWQPHTREPERPGRQGQDLIPKKGDTGTFYLTGGGQKPLEMVTPNGVVVDKTKKPVATPAINLWVDLGLGLISEADAKAKMEPADADFKTTLDSELKELNGDLHGVRQVTGKQFSDILAKMDQVSSFSSTSVIGMTKEHGYLEVKFFLASNRSYVAIVCAPLGDFPAATHNKLRELLDIKTKDESKK